jgi:thiamine-phosphate pyrophosphorylase
MSARARAPLPRAQGRIYAIADAGVLGVRAVAPAVAAMAEEGVSWIQLRAKRLSGEELWRLAGECLRALAGSGRELWIDDRADLAALLPFAGLHLGQADLPPAAARRVVGEETWIGLSTHDEAQLGAANDDPAVAVVAFGPIFPTTGKERPGPAVGLERLRAARRRTAKPLVAIGGIDESNLAQVLAAGADWVALLGAICRGDVRRNCRRLLAAAA